MTADQQRLKKATNRFRAAAATCANDLVSLAAQSTTTRAAREILNTATVEMFAVTREIEEGDPEMTPVRTPSQHMMRAVKTGEIVAGIFEEAKAKR